MSLWAKLIGNDSIIDSGAKAIDKSFYTTEEEAENWSLFLSLYEPFKVAQRFMMLIVVPPYIFMWLLTGFLEITNEIAGKEWDFDKIYLLLHGDVGTLAIMIGCFYFGGGAIEGVVKRFKANR